MSTKAKSVNFRNPAYIVYVLFGIVLLWVSARTAGARPTILDTAIVQIVSLLPSWLNGIFTAISGVGSLLFTFALALTALLLSRYKASLKFAIAGSGAYLLSGLIQDLSWHSNNTFPSEPVAIVTALALVGYQYTAKSRHRYVSCVVALVAISQIYLGHNVPVDLVGGFAIGLVVGSVICYLFGRRIFARVTPKAVHKALLRNDYPVKTVKVLGVDARGSSPFMVTFSSGKHYFLKVVNRDNFIADWLFKSYRQFVYRRLEDEAPFFSPKRQIEHESYVANLAYANGIKTPRIVGVLEVKPNNWAQIQEAVDGKSLDKVETSSITDALLDNVLKLINELHSYHIIHRDLRAANIFIDKKNTPWLIDFGFAEASSRQKQTYRDVVEVICSIGAIVGAERIVKASLRNIPNREIIQALPYMQYACLSGETTRLLKLDKSLLPQIVEGLKKGTKQESIKSAKVSRFRLNMRRR